MSRRRRFSKTERFVLYLAADGKCTNCGAPLTESFHADHLRPYSKDGETDVINGQALCPKCNQEKSDKYGDETRMENPNVNLRTWQREQQDAFEQLNEKWFVLVATPGAGKTAAMLHNANYMLKADKADMVVVVVPSTMLKYQWRSAAWEKFGLALKSDFEGYVSDDFDGVIVTYQQIAGKAGRDMVRHLHRLGRVFAIFDEPHHMADGRSWGDEAKYALSDSVGGVLGTGTPFRSDDYPIPFVKYHPDTHELTAHYEYLYADGLIDEVVRAIFFRKIDTEASWYSYTDEIVTATFEDDLDERQMSERLNTAIDPDSKFVRDVLKQAYAELANIRAIEQPDAKMLIVCKSTGHAEAVAKRLTEITGTKPVVVTSDEEHGDRQDIEKFKTSTDPVIIAVDMISEGVDIPSLRSMVYLTNKVAPLYFMQAVGRVVRVQKGMELVNGYVYLPSDPRLLKMAHEIKLRRNHVLENYDRTPVKPERDGTEAPAIRQTSMYQPIEATAIDAGGIYDGADYSPLFIADTLIWIRQNELRIPVEEGCKIRAKFLTVSSAPAAPAPTVTGPNPEDTLMELGRTANRHAFNLAQLLGVEAPEIHSRWVRQHGGKWQKQEDIAGLERKIKWLKGEIARVKRG